VIDVQSTGIEGNKTTVNFVVRDAQSPIQRVEYSLDASSWHVAYPIDGIPDSRQEGYAVVIDGVAARSVIIRATDAMSNVATAVAGIKQ
ncbi:MAG TPA: hypothetical protein VGL62_07055, partial [Vicinamibacterales bacterium]